MASRTKGVDHTEGWALKVSALIAVLIAGVASSSAEESLRVQVPNASFEEVSAGGRPSGWSWGISRGALATCASVEGIAHSGTRSVHFANRSGLAPHVYGRFSCEVPVEPSTRYRLSCWVKALDAGGGLHFTDWKSYMLHVPSGTYDWQQISTLFTTQQDQSTLAVGFNIVNVTEAIWIDDVALEPVWDPIRLRGVKGEVGFWLPKTALTEGDKQLAVRLYHDLPPNFGGEVVVTLGTGARASAPISGVGRAELQVGTEAIAGRRALLRLAVKDAQGREVGAAQAQVEKLSAAYALERLQKAEERLARIEGLLSQARQRGVAVDYPTVWYSIGKRAITWGREDVEHQFIKRACWVADETNEMFDKAEAKLQSALRGEAECPSVPLYVTSPIEIRDGSFIADTQLSTGGPRVRRPVFFCGMGAFGAARRDVDVFPSHGYNIIQVEFGPSSLFPDENTVTDGAIAEFVNVLDRAAQANVAVNLLISPHYFPQWATEKWPFLSDCGGGFIGFCVDASESRAIHEKYLRMVIPRIKDHPALHSICLSNEPIYERDNCELGRQLWHAWLRDKHGSIETLNDRWRTNYGSFDDIPQPPLDLGHPTPALYDWSRFNADRFSGWHKWMADIIHEMAPDLPVHAKIMAMAFDRGTVLWGVDPAQFASLSQINGNDCWKWYNTSAQGEWASSWHTENMFFDLQKSLADKPVFNSEDHVIIDRDTSFIPEAHIQNVLWQGAIHGRGASTMWVWERTHDPNSALAESVMHRPACAAAVGTTNLDLLRCAEQVTAIQRVPPEVALLFSWPSMVWGESHSSAMGRVYEALNFTGRKIGFVTEQQIAMGALDRFKVIVVAGATHVSDATFARLRSFAQAPGKRLIVYGRNCLRRDEYGRTRRVADLISGPGIRRVAPGASGEALREALTEVLEDAGVVPLVSVTDARTRKPAWGVEWLCARHDGRLLVNLCNYRREPLRVRVHGGPYVDLITGDRLGEVVELQPLVPVLATESR